MPQKEKVVFNLTFIVWCINDIDKYILKGLHYLQRDVKGLKIGL